MGDPCREFAERRQLLSHDDLVLRLLQLGQHVLEFVVLALEFLRELLDEVEALHFQGVTPEHVEGGGHLRDLVTSADVGPDLQVALGHVAHPFGEHPDAPQQHPADEEPGDQQRARDADREDGEQQHAAREDRLRGCLRGFLGARLGRADQAVHLRNQLNGEIAIEVEQLRLAFGDPQFSGEQIEHRVLARAEGEETHEDRRRFGVEGRTDQGRQVPVDTADRGFEALPQRLDQRGVGQGEGVGQELGCDVHVRLQLGETAVADELALGEMLLARRRGRREAAIPGQCEEELVVDSGGEGVVQTGSHLRKFQLQRFPARGQFEHAGCLTLEGLDVRDDRVGTLADAQDSLLLAVALLQGGHLLLERGVRLVDAEDHLVELFRTGRDGEVGSRGYQVAAVLGDAEGGRQFRHAALVDLALDGSHLVEREPADQTGGQGEEDRAAHRQIQLGRDPEAALEQALQLVDHVSTSCSVSIGW